MCTHPPPARTAPGWWLPVVVVLGLALHLPSLGLGFWADDYVHQLVLDGDLRTTHLRPSSVYDFGDAADWQSLGEDAATRIWWTSPDWKIRFLRPLSSLALRAEHALLGGWAPGYHVMSLAWYAACLLLAHGVYRAIDIPPRAAVLATALWATTNGSALPVGWIANRNTVEATALTLAAVLVAARTRRLRWVALSLALASAACAAKESGVVAFPLVGAVLLLRARGGGASLPRRGAAVGAAAAVVLAAAYVATLMIAGYGTRSVFYATPWGDPFRYLANLGVLFSAGLLRLLAPVPLDLMQAVPSAARVVPWLGLAIVLPIAWVISKPLRGSPTAGFLALWVALGLLPQGGTLASDRLLMEAAVGSAGLLALFVTAVLGAGRDTTARWQRRLAMSLLITAGALSALFTVVQSATMRRFARESRAVVLSADVGPPELGTRDVFLLQSGSGFIAFALPSTWWIESRDHDLRFWAVQLGPRALSWRREDQRTCLIRSLDEPFFTGPFESVYRSSDVPPSRGTVFHAGDLRVEVVSVDAAGVRALRLHFARDLDDPRVRFLVDRGGRFVRQPAPAVGETTLIPRASPTIPMLP